MLNNVNLAIRLAWLEIAQSQVVTTSDVVAVEGRD